MFTSQSTQSTQSTQSNTVKSTVFSKDKLSNPTSIDDMILCYATLGVNDLSLSDKNLILCEYPNSYGCNRLYSKIDIHQDKWIERVMSSVQIGANPYK
jgi:hypothetical protein